MILFACKRVVTAERQIPKCRVKAFLKAFFEAFVKAFALVKALVKAFAFAFCSRHLRLAVSKGARVLDPKS